jgi:hypothetical protein
MKGEVIEKIAALVTAAFGLVAALAWNGAIKAVFAKVFSDPDGITHDDSLCSVGNNNRGFSHHLGRQGFTKSKRGINSGNFLVYSPLKVY